MNINQKFFPTHNKSQHLNYTDYSFRMPLFIKYFISEKSRGFKSKVIDSLCLYALDQLKGDTINIKEKRHDVIIYSFRDNEYIIDCNIKEKSLHQISNALKFSLKGFLINQNVSVKISVLCDIAIKMLNNDDEIIVCF